MPKNKVEPKVKNKVEEKLPNGVCTYCKGSGKDADGDPCWFCDGTGKDIGKAK